MILLVALGRNTGHANYRRSQVSGGRYWDEPLTGGRHKKIAVKNIDASAPSVPYIVRIGFIE